MIKKEKNDKEEKNEDRLLWQSVTTGIEPLPHRKKNPVKTTKPQKTEIKAPPPKAAALPSKKTAPSAGFEIDRRTHGRIKRGQKKIEARLDLHGLRQEEAHDRLIAFVEKSCAAQKRLLLVITGKGERGQGVLRQNVPRWLKDSHFSSKILMIEPAQIKDGGSGAFYVFLRRER